MIEYCIKAYMRGDRKCMREVIVNAPGIERQIVALLSEGYDYVRVFRYS